MPKKDKKNDEESVKPLSKIGKITTLKTFERKTKLQEEEKTCEEDHDFCRYFRLESSYWLQRHWQQPVWRGTNRWLPSARPMTARSVAGRVKSASGVRVHEPLGSTIWKSHDIFTHTHTHEISYKNATGHHPSYTIRSTSRVSRCRQHPYDGDGDCLPRAISPYSSLGNITNCKLRPLS